MENLKQTKPEPLIFRSRTEHKPNFLKILKESEPEQNRTLIIKEPEPNSNPEFSMLSHLHGFHPACARKSLALKTSVSAAD